MRVHDVDYMTFPLAGKGCLRTVRATLFELFVPPSQVFGRHDARRSSRHVSTQRYRYKESGRCIRDTCYLELSYSARKADPQHFGAAVSRGVMERETS